MSARSDGLAFHWDEKILAVPYDSSPKSQAHPRSHPTWDGAAAAPSPLPVSQEPGRVRQHLAGSSMSFSDAPLGAVCGGKGGPWPRVRSGAVRCGAPRAPCRQAALLPRHIHRARPRCRQDRPGPDRTGPSPVRSGLSPVPTGPTAVGPGRAGPFTATTGPSRFGADRSPARTSPSLVRLDHPPSPPSSQPGAGAYSPAPERCGAGGLPGLRREAARAGRGAGMAAMSSLEAVRRKIRSLQEQADAAEERAGRLQREVDQERALREEVGPPLSPARARGLRARVPGRGCPACLPGPWGGRPLPSPPCPTRWLLPAGRPRGRPAVLRSRLGNPSAAWAGPRCSAQGDSSRCAGQQQKPELEWGRT